MSARRTARMLVAAALASLAAGCFAYRGPRALESSLEDQMGAGLEREFGFKLGWTATKLTGTLVGRDGDADDLSIRDLSGVAVAIYKVPAGARGARLDPRKLGLRRYETVLDVRDRDGQVLLLTRSRSDAIREALFVSVDREEVVVARLRGRLDRLIERAVRGADDGGVLGARRAVSVARN